MTGMTADVSETTPRAKEDIATFAKRFKPGTKTLLVGMSGAGKTTLAFRLAQEVGKKRRTVVVWDEAYVFDGARRLGESDEGGPEYIHRPRAVSPELAGVDLAGADFLVVGHHYSLDRSRTFAVLAETARRCPSLSILLFGVFQPHIVRALEGAGPCEWLHAYKRERVGAHVGEVDSFAIIKPADGWTYGRSFRGRAGTGSQTVHFLKPRREVVEVPAPTRRPW